MAAATGEKKTRRKRPTLEAQIKTTEDALIRAKHRYDELAAKLAKLRAKKRESDTKKILNALADSDYTVDDIVKYIGCKTIVPPWAANGEDTDI